MRSSDPIEAICREVVLCGLRFPPVSCSERSRLRAPRGLKADQFNASLDERTALTPQSIDSPLFKVFESNFGCGRYVIDVQAVGIILLLMCWASELLLPVINGCPSLWIDTTGFVPDHALSAKWHV